MVAVLLFFVMCLDNIYHHLLPQKTDSNFGAEYPNIRLISGFCFHSSDKLNVSLYRIQYYESLFFILFYFPERNMIHKCHRTILRICSNY